MKSLPPVSCNTTRTGCFPVPDIVQSSLKKLCELILRRGGDQLKHTSDTGRGFRPPGLAIEAQVATGLRGVDQGGAGVFAHVESAHQVEGSIDEVGGRER